MKLFFLTLMSLSLAACLQSTLTATGADHLPSTATHSQGKALKFKPLPFKSQLLQGYYWQLTNAIDKNGQPITLLLSNLVPQQPHKPLSLSFSEQALTIQNLACNINRLGIRWQNNQFEVNQPVVSTMMACPPAITQRERLLIGLLSAKPTLSLQSGNPSGATQLTLTAPTGERLIFQGIATPETRYGSQAEIIFLEVSPKTQTCDAGVRQMQCLQVREVKYDAQGIKQPGNQNWQNFYAPIEGYEHRNDQRVILRVKKYPIKNPPADSSNAAYVLDTIVEQQLL